MSSEDWTEQGVRPVEVSDFLRRGQRAYPEIKRRDKRLLEEALDFLLKAEGAVDPEQTLKSLYAIYKEVDTYADYIKPGEREFFPTRKRSRTLERFLEGFRYIYYILLRAQDRLSLSNSFSIFWGQCRDYLGKCGYSNKRVLSICGNDTLFSRQSFNYWRGEFKDEEEGFLIMFSYFKACFGIEGNDAYCKVSGAVEETYDWKRMKACFEKLKEWKVEETHIPEPEYEEWSEKNKLMLRQTIESIRHSCVEEKEKADKVLETIKRRNEQAEASMYERATGTHG